MSEWSNVFLFLHILSAIVAFGPTFVFGPLASLIQKEPQHAQFGMKVSNMIENKLVLPISILVPLFGAGLIITRQYEFWSSTWLMLAAGIYTVTFFIAVVLNRPIGKQITANIESMVAGNAGPETVEDLQRLGKKAQMYGILMTLMFLVVLGLMIWKPGSCFITDPSC